jgi:hypothetical protein
MLRRPKCTLAVVWLLTVAVLAPQPRALAGDCRQAAQCSARGEPLGRAKSSIVEFETSPFPYDGMVPEKDVPFLDLTVGYRKAHRTPRGRVLWEDTTFSDRHVLLHIPKGYDFTRPGVMVVFFHGHGATLRRDVRDRQLVPTQVSASDINAVLVAPQFAVNASDSSAGKFWEPGAFRRFVAEAGVKLAELHGNPASAHSFATMPIVIIAYSGGYLATAWCLEVGGVEERLSGVVLLDALYGELDKFAAWSGSNRTKFLVSAYSDSSLAKNLAFRTMLAEHEIPSASGLKEGKWRHGVTFLATDSETKHDDFVTQAWVEFPIADILRRLGEFRRK